MTPPPITTTSAARGKGPGKRSLIPVRNGNTKSDCMTIRCPLRDSTAGGDRRVGGAKGQWPALVKALADAPYHQPDERHDEGNERRRQH